MTELLPLVLFVLGIGFLVANLRLIASFLRFLRVRSTAVLTWPTPKPPFYALFLALGVVLGLLVFIKIIVQQRPAADAFAVFMMMLYYGYLIPLSLRIRRGFYEQGVWAEGGFLPYSRIGGIAWREQPEVTLLIIPRMKRLAHRLVVPDHHYGAARRLLRDRIAEGQIEFVGAPLDLTDRDQREDV
jgi:hypothetical protein